MKKNKIKIMTKKDYIIITIIGLLYTVFSFINLGSTINPQTFYKFSENEAITISLNSIDDVIRIKFYNGDLSGEYAIYTSLDNENFQYVNTFLGNGAFSWNQEKILQRTKYIKIIPLKSSSLGEIALYNNAKDLIKIKSITTDNNIEIKKLTDEIKTIPEQISYMNSTYFDEIYFARTTYNYMKNMPTYEWTHPPLGKLLQTIPVKIFNTMAPFYYRLMGNVAGILMIIVMYIFSKSLFKKTTYAAFSSLLLCFDTFHFAQTRMGTVDGFLVLFIMLSIYFMYRYVSIEKSNYNLVLSGLFFGLSICIKWTGFLSGLALAIIYFSDLIKNKKTILESITKGFIFFVIMPLIMYIAIYFIFPNNNIAYTDNIKSLIKQTEAMFTYHSNLNATHPFSSKWYTWPLSLKPVWYYTENYANNLKGTIVGIGNIVIWWMSIISVPYLIIKLIKTKEKESFVILISIIALWLPYVFIGRVMFLYHYFPVLPFMILSITMLFKKIATKTKVIPILYLLATMIFFIIYYPVVSGLPVDSNYIESLKLLPSWIF